MELGSLSLMALIEALSHARVNNPVFAANPWTSEAIWRVVDLPALVGHDSVIYARKQTCKPRDPEARVTPAVREDQYSLRFAEQMYGRETSSYPIKAAPRAFTLPPPGLPIVFERTKDGQSIAFWSYTVTCSNKVLKAHDKMLAKLSETMAPASGLSSSSTNPLLSLYADYAQSVERTRLTHTVANLSAASLHLIYLLAGNVYLPSETRQIEITATSLSVSCRVSYVASIFVFYEQFAGKSAILESWGQFGSICRPSHVAQADAAVWRALFASTKRGNVLVELRSALSELDPAILRSPSPWFKLVSRKPSLRAPIASTSRIDDIPSDSEDAHASSATSDSLARMPAFQVRSDFSFFR
ncbi:hypothetical protein DXG01_003620 [Tephrocybe rancida]|nr:hypothetical protein DXG01_003620 [Tephrocybe rancida]